LELSAWLRAELRAFIPPADQGHAPGARRPEESATQIIPVIIGEAPAAMALSKRLLEAGFFVPAIRPPTVPKGTSRLRVSLSSRHNKVELERFVDVLRHTIG
jgi:8-amino-7-oxononanoate synthase